jgi:hypothetical protein
MCYTHSTKGKKEIFSIFATQKQKEENMDTEKLDFNELKEMAKKLNAATYKKGKEVVSFLAKKSK